MELYDRLVALGASPAAYPPISEALSRLLAAEVAPAYDSLFPQVRPPPPSVSICFQCARGVRMRCTVLVLYLDLRAP